MTGRRCFSFLLLICILVHNAPAAGPEKRKGASPEKAAVNDDYKAFSINGLFSYYSNNGDGSYNKFTVSGGLEWPKGSDHTVVFEDGLIWGGFHKGIAIPKVGGSLYRHALQAGRILIPGGPAEPQPPIADDPLLEKYRVYRVRPDVNPTSLFADVQSLLNQESALISRDQAVSARELYNAYVKDWNEWPARTLADPAGLAPFTDVNKNGTYETTTDIPGYPGAAQTLYYVANDLNSSRTQILSGSSPIGLEVHRTIWGYDRTAVLGRSIFTCTMLINKSGASVDSMFIGQWSDPDVGDGGDDLAGCDTLRSLGYAYNADANDNVYGTNVPAVGYQLLQGAHVPSSGDSAHFQGGYRTGFKELGMTAFVLFNYEIEEPNFSMFAPLFYRYLNGLTYTGRPFIDPGTGQQTTSCFSGDPVTGQGWVDSLDRYDRQMMLSCGPFRLANNDTQEVVVATHVAQGGNRLSSILALRKDADIIRGAFRSGFRLLPPSAEVAVAFPAADRSEVLITADAHGIGAQSVSALLKNDDGIFAGSIALNDSGRSGDAVGNDSIFSAKVPGIRMEKPLTLDLSVTDLSGAYNWPRVAEGITTAGPLPISGLKIFSDNVNSDGIPNPGENIRFGVSFQNLTPFSLSVHVRSDADPDPDIELSGFAPSSIAAMTYNPAERGSYFAIDIPSYLPGSSYKSYFRITDTNGNRWRDSVTFLVSPYADSLREASAARVSGSATGTFGIMAVDQAALKRHLYVIRGTDSINAQGEKGISLKDSTDGRILFLNHPLPDSLGHNMPVTDGFKVLRGSIEYLRGYKDWDIGPDGIRHWTWLDAAGFGLEGFDGGEGGTIGNAHDHWFTGGVPQEKLRTVEIRFANADGTWDLLADQNAQPNFSKGYRYLRSATSPPADSLFAPWIIRPLPGLAYQDYNWGVPWAAYDVEANPPRRLMVGFLENNTALGLVDGKAWPRVNGTYPSATTNVGATGPREWFFIFDVPYSTTPDPTLQTDILNNEVPMMWMGTVSRRAAAPNYLNTSTFTIYSFQPPSAGDVWVFHPDTLRLLTVPEAFALLQNYPNPFNPATQILYDLSQPSRVTLRVYDILGREVITLVDGDQRGGRKIVSWNGTAAAGYHVASGVYFYRLEVRALHAAEGGVPSSRPDFTKTMKLIVLR